MHGEVDLEEEHNRHLLGKAQLQLGPTHTPMELAFAAFERPRRVCHLFWNLNTICANMGRKARRKVMIGRARALLSA